jgi:poly(ADP-ribose) glycohydrolase ARH3
MSGGDPSQSAAPRWPAQVERARGALLAAACGDAVGAPFEGTQVVQPAAVLRWADAADPLRYTDDTALMLTLAEHLADRDPPGIDQDLLAAAFAETWQDAPGRGYSATTAHVFRRVLAGTPWRTAAAEAFAGRGNHGNGAAMRVAPVGLLPGPLPAIAGQVSQPAFQARLRRLAVLARVPYVPRDVAAQLGNDASALATVPAALAAFLHSPDDPVEAVHFAVAIGGDTDTIAALAAALAGARTGEGAVPARWRARLEHEQRIRAVATRLAGHVVS